MARGYISSGGGNPNGSSDCTVVAGDVLKGKTYIGADTDDEVGTGTLELTGNITSADIRKGKTGYSNDPKQIITGTMIEQGGSTTTPGTVAKTVVAANRYVNGNIVVAGSANLVPANIKKGVNIFGVVGTHSGYVPTATDLYLRGNNISGWSATNTLIKFDTGQITWGTNSGGIRTVINFTGYSRLNVEYSVTSTDNTYVGRIVLYNSAGSEAARLDNLPTNYGNYTNSLNISALQLQDTWRLELNNFYKSKPLAVYRIWLS